jgi:hypothetical protein
MACHPALFVVRLVSPVASHSIPTSNRPKGPVLLAARCRSDFPAPDFEDSGPISSLMRLLPWNDFRKPFPNVPQVAAPRGLDRWC